jgi:hypothetical protein
MVQSKEAPVTVKGWEDLYTMVSAESALNGNHFLVHIQGALYAIRGLYAAKVFKKGV